MQEITGGFQATFRDSQVNSDAMQVKNQAFEHIKARIFADRHDHTHKHQPVSRLFSDVVTKEELDNNRKETRKLNVRALAKAMENQLIADGFEEADRVKIIREYKTKLKEEHANGIAVKDASSFYDYVIVKNQKEPENSNRKIVDRFLLLGRKKFERIDQEVVTRFSGVGKAVYVFKNLAILVAKKPKHEKALKEEYEVTVDIRVNEMKRVLNEISIDRKLAKEIIKDYRAAILDNRSGVENTVSFFHSVGDKYKLDIDINDIAVQIDKNLERIDCTRKRVDEDGVIFYTAEKAKSDLYNFLKSGEINTLSQEQFKELMDSFDEMMASMERLHLLHGDIKPDNILIYRTEENGKTKYTVKISDFGKTQFKTKRKLHLANIRFHKGFFDTMERQTESLNMIKLLMINSATHIQLTQNESAVVNKLLETDRKISDIVFTKFSLGGFLVERGTKKYNYFSNVSSKNIVLTVFMYLVYKCSKKTSRMRMNTEKDVLEFLNRTKEESISTNDLQKMALDEVHRKHLMLTRRLMTLELLYRIFPDSNNKLAFSQEISQCETQLKEYESELSFRKGG